MAHMVLRFLRVRAVRVLSALTSSELQSDDDRRLSPEAIRLLAEAGGTTQRTVEKLLDVHASYKGDRTWFMRRLELRIPLPKTKEDAMLEAAYDRPGGLSSLPYGEAFEERLTRFRSYSARWLMFKDGKKRWKRLHRVAWAPRRQQWHDRWKAHTPAFAVDPYTYSYWTHRLQRKKAIPQNLKLRNAHLGKWGENILRDEAHPQ
eukprot:GHVT01039546.1.p2 GENE.GHVT01039546.1~~GHVT01039546.1.p2  ORF type:complete len:204 (+),score=38.28 GHVT01039546.1:92-703(+)